jgi:hypothetical protein
MMCAIGESSAAAENKYLNIAIAVQCVMSKITRLFPSSSSARQVKINTMSLGIDFSQMAENAKWSTRILSARPRETNFSRG